MKNKNNLNTVFYKAVGENKRITFFTGILIAASVCAALLPPLVLEQIVNRLALQQGISLSLALGYFGLLALSDLLESGQSGMITVFGQKMTHGLRSALCAKVKRLPADYFTKHAPAQIASRFVNDVDVVDSLFTNGIIGMVADGFKVLSILAIIFYKSTGLGILMLFVTPALFVMTRQFQKRMLKAQMANRVAVSKVNNHVPETIHNIRTIHTLFRQKYMEEKYDSYIQESYRALNKSNVYDSIYSPIVIFVSSCVIALMMVLAALGGGMQQLFGITVGTAVAMIAYVGKVFEPLESIGMEIQNIQSAVAGVKRINEFLSEEERTLPQETSTQALSRTNKETAVEFCNVTFGYDDKTMVLQNRSFSVGRGEAVTFVGRTGAGKSTIFKLILGLYTPQKGKIWVDGMDAAAIQDAQKRKMFGYVEQNFHSVAGTVAEQISLFDDAVGQEQIEEATKLVGLHENILELDQQYNTPVEKLTFSQGQFQLLSIARAIVAQPKILLLDEITANLDSETEQRVLQGLECACRGRTVLSISHRLSESTHSSRFIQIAEG
ncbi:MAG: ABC transporter ATP-binding protein [Oscillospiraceae bacterium]|nr:ABC transporter ATP-binding protein [Oscillospiraceae bacterium]